MKYQDNGFDFILEKKNHGRDFRSKKLGMVRLPEQHIFFPKEMQNDFSVWKQNCLEFRDNIRRSAFTLYVLTS